MLPADLKSGSMTGEKGTVRELTPRALGSRAEANTEARSSRPRFTPTGSCLVSKHLSRPAALTPKSVG